MTLHRGSKYSRFEFLFQSIACNKLLFLSYFLWVEVYLPYVRLFQHFSSKGVVACCRFFFCYGKAYSLRFWPHCLPIIYFQITFKIWFSAHTFKLEYSYDHCSKMDLNICSYLSPKLGRQTKLDIIWVNQKWNNNKSVITPNFIFINENHFQKNSAGF